MGFKLASALVSIEAVGLGKLATEMSSAKRLFSDAGAGMQASIGKSMASVRALFTGFGGAVSGAGAAAGGLATSLGGLGAAAGVVAGRLAGIGGNAGGLSDALTGLRTASSGVGVAFKGAGQTAAGTWGVLSGGVGVLRGLSDAAGHAGAALRAAASPTIGAAFKRTFALGRSAASAFGSGASAALRGVSSAARSTMSAVKSMSSGMMSSFSAVLSSLHPLRLALVSLGGVIAGGLGMGKLAADAEATEASFKTMLGGGDAGAAKAKQVISGLTKLGAETPYELPELTGAGRKLLAFGTDDKKLVGELRMIGDVASGIQAPIGEIAEIYGKARVQGRLFAEDVNQLTGRGIPVIQELAKQFHVSDSEVKKLVEDGKIGFPEMERAFQAMTAQGGKFHGMMEEQSKTAKGLWSTMMDNIKSVGRELGSAMLPAMKDLMGLFSDMTGAASWVEPLKGQLASLSMAVVDGVKTGIAWFRAGSIYVKASFATLGAELSLFGRLVTRAFTAMRDLFAGLLPSMGDFGDSFLSLQKNAKFFFDNFETYAALGWEHTKLFALNSWEHIKTFFANIVVSLKWLWDNWRNVFQTMWDFTKSVFVNLSKNMGAFFLAAKDWVAGKGFDYQWTGLLDGFESSISQMPRMMEAAVRETTPEIERLRRALGRAARDESINGKVAEPGTPDYYAIQDDKPKSKNEAKKPAGKPGKLERFDLVEFAKHLQQGSNPKEAAAEARDKRKTAGIEQIAHNTRPENQRAPQARFAD